ncbi:MAG: DUF389 domain-containing protein [Ruminococcus sp.]|uniref:DUF389 domain-containing protein n=1 Tax=Ruminococcus sp. TaxID=41978 RepID=UPI002872D0CE|nr:DUF389 domain-containing protein [Ruminococcus sp.]MBQ3284777.1 DUF389 domain-containing protein [Ruminococcus sp.]
MKTTHEKPKAILKKMFSLKEDTATHEEIRDRLLSGGQITGTNMCVLICAMIIASVGLNVGSAAVIIGAMLISPLMGSILAMAYGLVSNDFKLWRNHAIGFAMQIIISLLTSTIYFLLTPLKGTTTELLARTSPTFYDVIIATAGGIAGIIGQTRTGKFNNIIPGVAIATALMPPICTCGYSIANGEWKMLCGAAYLFIVNAYFIFLASAIVLSLLKTPKVRELTEQEWKKLRFRMIRNTLIVLIPSIILGVLMLRG